MFESQNYKYPKYTFTGSKFISLGCWKDTIDRAMPSIEHSHPILGRSYKSRKNAIHKCYELALSLGYTVFAIQDGGQCFSSSKAKDTYRKHGSSSECLEGGKGGPLANQVYEIKSCIYYCDVSI